MARVRIHSLTLTGFKSFPDETRFTFPGDVCAIIGPNGCGKSNIVDGILWVLGEQSPSLMRLKAMGDVVFSGAAGRQPGGAAEVLLTLKSDGGQWEKTDGELVICRRVYRSGPSDYRLNGSSARLRDVFDELASVGLGIRNYAIIEQGRVGQVLSARATDRRALLEEAAGITRYKARRHEAELKLEHTRHNLTRLDDVVAEVERSLRQIKRQARQAERYRELESELKDRLRSLHTVEAHALDRQRRELAQRRALAQNEVAAAAAALGGAEADLKDARRNHETCRGELEKVRAELATLRASRERLQAFLERSADLLANLRASLDRATQDEAAASATAATLDRQLADAQVRQGSLATALDEVQGRVGACRTEETGSRKQLDAAEQRAAELRQELLRAISSLTTARNQVGGLDREQDRLAYALTKLDQERERLQERRTETRQQYDAASSASKAAASAAEELDRRRQSMASERAALNEESTAAKHEVESLGHTLWELRHRLAGIDRELARHATAVDQLAGILPPESLAGQVSDYLQPEAALAPVLDRVWADRIELPVVRELDLGPDQREVLSRLEGRMRLVVAGDAPPVPATPPPAGARPLFDAAGIAPEHLPWLARALPPAYQCSDRVRTRELADEMPGALFLDPDNILWHGRTMEPPTAGTSLRGALVLRQDKQNLELAIADAGQRLESGASRRRELALHLDSLDERLAEVNYELVAAEQERARTAAVEESLGHELSRVEHELEAANAEAQRSVQQRRDLVRRRSQAEKEVERLEARSLQAEQAVDEADAAVEALRDSAATAQRSLERWGAEARLAQERVAAAGVEANRIEEEQRTVRARLDNLRADKERIAAELASTEDDVVRSRARLTEEQGLLGSAADEERNLEQGVQTRTSLVERGEKEVRSRRDQHELTREQLHQLTLEQTRADSEWERLRDATLSDIAITPDQLLELEAPAEEGVEGLRAHIEELRAGMEKIGPVNLLAVKESDELSTRLEFLREQRRDLVDSLRSLEATIREIDTTCTERFVETFEQVNVVFAETFGRLFGGGTAHLELIDEDDPLESGVDIAAQPPGKRNQSVQLLSGGEKALTALSLLIALFRIRPAPFCILDEVDAPLDDANVERLADLVSDMTEHTQFVLITHNRRTMARADVLYGVTMEEPGVSKVVSVRLEE